MRAGHVSESRGEAAVGGGAFTGMGAATGAVAQRGAVGMPAGGRGADRDARCAVGSGRRRAATGERRPRAAAAAAAVLTVRTAARGRPSAGIEAAGA